LLSGLTDRPLTLPLPGTPNLNSAPAVPVTRLMGVMSRGPVVKAAVPSGVTARSVATTPVSESVTVFVAVEIASNAPPPAA
jgi:hypothetical protein